MINSGDWNVYSEKYKWQVAVGKNRIKIIQQTVTAKTRKLGHRWTLKQ